MRRCGLGALVAFGIGVAAWWWLRPSAVEPPLPPNVQDPDVLAVIDKARREVRSSPRSAGAWGRLGSILLAHLCTREADQCFETAARLDPGEARWPYLRAAIAARFEPNPEAVVPLLRQAAAGRAAAEEHIAARLALAEALLEHQDWDEAEALFREQPNSPRAALGLGRIAAARGHYQTAETFLSGARNSPSAEKKATALLAACARGRGDLSAANRYEEHYAALPDDDPWPDPFLKNVFQAGVGRRFRTLEAETAELDRRFGDAAALYLELAEREPTATAYTAAGFNLARAGRLDQALPLLRKAVELDPHNANAHYRLAQALYTQGEQQALDSAAAQAAWREAATSARRATEEKPGHALAFLVWGRALLKLGQTTEALEPLRNAVACRPERFDLQFALGEALVQSGHHAEAAQHLENARQLNPQDPRPTQALEQIRRKKGT